MPVTLQREIGLSSHDVMSVIAEKKVLRASSLSAICADWTPPEKIGKGVDKARRPRGHRTR